MSGSNDICLSVVSLSAYRWPRLHLSGTRMTDRCLPGSLSLFLTEDCVGIKLQHGGKIPGNAFLCSKLLRRTAFLGILELSGA